MLTLGVTFFPRGFRPPMTPRERKRKSRRFNPALVEAYNAKRRAQRQAIREHVAALKLLARQRAAEPLALPAPAIRQPLLLPAPPVRLCLPAPVEQLPLFILNERAPEPVLVEAAQREEPRLRRAA